jgi:hypothetical protein
MRRLRALSEVECYIRCYGALEGNVRVIRRKPSEPRLVTTVSGEHVRREFELRLDARAPEAA